MRLKEFLFVFNLNFLIFFIKPTDSVILTPPYFNLVSNKRVYASATCGEGVREPELYCKLTGSTANDKETSTYANLIQGQYCDYCDPNDPYKNHHANYSIDGTDRWWQSPPLSRSLDFNQVNLTIDFGQEFHVAYIYIKMANSPRPGVWALEKSLDYGETYQPWQYFADTPSDCYNYFNTQANQRVKSDDDVICTTDYSKVLPVEGGEILVSLVNNRPNSKNFTHSDLLQKWTRATNVRLRLMRTKNLLGHLMAVAKQDPTVTRRYFYSIRDISIGGRCVCNGHAQYCEASNPASPDKLICRCSHNTCGDQCETCCDGFVQKRWQPNRENQEFECEPCQCYGHSNNCTYDPEIDRKKLSVDIHGKYEGGGVCQNCQHNTQGINCQECIPGYYRPFGVPITSVDACKKCECDNPYSTGNCAQLTGECECKPQYTGYKCTQCANGYTDWPTCKKCDCDKDGRADSSCKLPCNCKFGYLGPFCDKCMERYYGFPNCQPCDCEREGTLDLNCNKETGQCICRPGYRGHRCDQCDDGYFGQRICTLCNCDVGTVAEVCDKQNGTCICAPNFSGERCNQCAPGFYNFPNCLPCNCDEEGSKGTTCTFYGNQPQCTCKEGRSGPRCDQCAPGYYKYPECIECQCDEAGSIGQSCDPISGKCNCKSNFLNDKCSECAPDFFNYPFCERCSCHPKGTADHFPGCNKELRMSSGIICPCKEYVTGRQCDKCKDRFYGLGTDSDKGCSACECNRNGTLNELDLCDQNSGQCQCKLFVDSNACNECKLGFHSLQRDDIFGCQECNCLPGSSRDGNCDRESGQCTCLPNIIGTKCDQPAPGFYIPNLHQLKYEIEDGISKGKQVRYNFSEEIFPKFSWRGFVHLNKIAGEVSQNISINKPGTYRMIIRYLNKNTSIAELSVKVRDLNSDPEEQKATVYLMPNSEPSFETVTVDQINALILELEQADYVFSFENQQDNLFVDYFVLLPSDYFETTVLTKQVVKACVDYSSNETCIQYKYPSIDAFTPVVIHESNDVIDSSRFVNLDAIKEFNHSHPLPLIATKLNQQNSITKNIKFPGSNNYILLIDFMNLNEEGQDINIEINHIDSNRRQSGRVFLYKCQITTLCREVVLSRDYNEPLQIDGKDSANILTKSPNKEVLVYQITLIPKDKFDINYIKMAPYCIVKDKKCKPLEYSPFIFTKIELESDDNSRQDLFRPSQKQVYDHIPSKNVIYLHNYYPEVTVPIQTNRRDQGDQMLIVHYYQPNHPTVGVTVFLDKNTNGTFQAPYCPSISGCRAMVKFHPNSDTFTNPDLQSVTLQLNQNGKDLWLEYLLLASATNVKPEDFEYAPIDMTSDFITKCASQHFNIEYYSSLFCDHAVLSLSAKYNNGAQPCDCNPQGSKDSDLCDYFGGQCDCKEHVIGRQCNTCKTGYYGFPNCQKCDCPTGNCNYITGECTRPPNTEDDGPMHCLDKFYGFHPIYGCDECNCELNGTVDRDPVCDKENGQCKCRNSIDGRKCDKCKAGFYEYPVCNACDCHEEGSLAQICDPQSSQCLCKENIVGERCDFCKQGTFNIEARNPKGCTQCFCFGQTSFCRMSDLYYVAENSLEDWKLASSRLNSEQSNIKINILSISDSLQLDLDDENLDSDSKLAETVYWSAPKEYLGNRVTSYGGRINYKIKVKVPEGTLMTVKPDLILVGSNMSLYFSSVKQPVNDETFENSIDILESQFNHLLTGTSATRDQLMIVLSSLSEVKLRATYASKLHYSELVQFEFDHAVEFQENLSSAEPALGAEQCYCPPNFKGYSCESCETGYYKVKGNGPGLFNCVPCQCNGHADTCDQETGECIACRDNTLGKNCELCKTGYHQINNECRLCPCPGPSEGNVFADSCMFDQNSNNVYYCNCLPGYAGQYCERCAPGYYGDPTRPGGKCLPCQCNNNIDMKDEGSCDQRTGACLKCLHNTAGLNCEKCADWHFGDPILAKNCKPCECDRLGSETCDAQTGECTCKENVIGYNCGSCGEDMWGFSKGEGCKKCNCDLTGSLSSQCDSLTGKCKCKPGVDGQYCDACASGHWNFTSNGCQDCKCKKSLGVKITNDGYECNATTGHCTCIEGVMGPECNECTPRWVLVKHQGCKKCDTCVHTLLDDVEELQMKANSIENGNKDSSLTFKAHNKLVILEDEFEKIKNSIDPNQYDSTPLSNLQRQIQIVQNDILGLKLMTEYDINDKIKLLSKLLEDAEMFSNEISELRNKLDVLDKLIDELDREDMKNFRNISEEQLHFYENLVDQIVKKDFKSLIEKHKNLLNEFIEANSSVQSLKNNYDEHTREIESIKNKNMYIQKSLIEMKALVDKAKNMEKFNDKDVEFKAYFDNLEQIRNETSQLQTDSANTLKKIEDMIKQGEEKLTQSNKELSDLNSKVEDLQNIYADHDTKYQELRDKCQKAQDKATLLTETGLKWKEKVMKSQEGLVAFEMAQVYDRIADTLNSAHVKSFEILRNYTDADAQLDKLLSRAKTLKTDSQDLSKTTNEEIEKKVKAESDYNTLNTQYIELDKKSKELTKSFEKIDQWINKTLSSDQTLTNLKNELENQKADLKVNEEKASDLIRKVQSLETLRVSLPDTGEDHGEQLLQAIENSIENLKGLTPSLNQSVTDLFKHNKVSSELEDISKELFELKMLIESTRQQINEVKVPVKFNDSSEMSLKLPDLIYPSMYTKGSIYLKTKEAFAPVALVYNESNPNEYVSVYLQQGRPCLQYKLSSHDSAPVILSTDQPINDGEWHKIELERVGKQAKLKVYSEKNIYQEKTKISDENSVVFNLDSNGARLVLGKFPYSQIPNDLRTVAAVNNQFRGTMNSLHFNDHSIGLWNFISAKNVKGDEMRDKSFHNDAQASSNSDEGVYFTGDSFICKKSNNYRFMRNKYNTIDVTLGFKSEKANGLLWIWYNDDRQFYAIYLENGHINIAFSNSAENRITLFDRLPSKSSYPLNDGKYHTIQVLLARHNSKSISEYMKLIRNNNKNGYHEIKISVFERFGREDKKLIDEKIYQTDKYLTISGNQCLGGMLATNREKGFKDSMFDSFEGYFTKYTFSMGDIDEKPELATIKSNSLYEVSSELSYGSVGPQQCDVQKSSQPVYIHFNVKNYTSLSQAEKIAIGFSTSNANGVLFYRVQDSNKIILQLKEGRMVLSVYSKNSAFSLKDNLGLVYNDNKLHLCYVIVSQESLELYVDDQLLGNVKFENTESSNTEVSALYVAGVPVSQRSIPEPFNNFQGCLVQIIYNENILDIKQSTSKSNKLRLLQCYRTPVRQIGVYDLQNYKQQTTAYINRLSQTVKSKADLLTNEECALSKNYDSAQLKTVGMRFGLSKQSRLEVHETLPIKISSFVSFKFRTLQSDGLMFYASDAQYNDFISVWIQDGYVNYAFDCGSGFMHIKTKRTYNDGRYHTLVVRRDKQVGTLIISDRTNTTVLETIENKSVGDSSSLSVVEPYYFGNIPQGDKHQLPAAQMDLIVTEPFVGCMSDFNIAYKILRNKINRVDLMNCSNNHESGVFFTGQSKTSYASLPSALSLKEAFEISFEIKSRTKNGVLMYLGGMDSNKNYALVELINGELIFKINLDGQENVAKYMPDYARNELCNASWIRIRVKKTEKGAVLLDLKGVESSSNYEQDLSYLANRLSANSNLYLGALPQQSLYAQISQTNEAYVGCVRDLIIRKLKANENTLQSKVLLDLNLESGVLNYCPLK